MKEKRNLFGLFIQGWAVPEGCNGSVSHKKEITTMPMTKEAAFNQARSSLGSSASVDSVIAAADKILAYINGAPTPAAAAPVVPPINKSTVPYYVVEYKNRKDNGTHLGAKHYRTYNGAMKNARTSTFASSGKRDRASRFVRVLKVAAA